MAEVQEVRANQGTADQLPPGAAATLNESMPADLAPQELAGPQNGTSADSGASSENADTSLPEPAAPSDYEPIYTPEGDDDAFITGPSTRPNESVTTGAFAGLRPSLSPELAAAVPLFVEAADLPDAPEQLRVLVALLTSASET